VVLEFRTAQQHTFDFGGKPQTVRNLLAYEPDNERPIEFVRWEADLR
jgi:hypothetical protein